MNPLAHRRISWLKLLFITAGLLVLAYLALVATRAVIAYRDVIEAKDLLVSAEETLDQAGLDVTYEELDEVEANLKRARGKVSSASGFLSNDPALWVARRLPWIGGQINSARDLAQVGLDGAEIGTDGVQIMRKLLAVKDEGTRPLGQKAIRFLDDVEPEIESNRDGDFDLYRLDLQTMQVDQLINDDATDAAVKESPDRQQIVFASNRDGDFEVYVMDSDGGDVRPLTDNDTDDRYPHWSPDGSQILFDSARDGNREIYVMNADGSDQRRLTTSPGRDVDPHWLVGS